MNGKIRQNYKSVVIFLIEGEGVDIKKGVCCYGIVRRILSFRTGGQGS